MLQTNDEPATVEVNLKRTLTLGRKDVTCFFGFLVIVVSGVGSGGGVVACWTAVAAARALTSPPPCIAGVAPGMTVPVVRIALLMTSNDAVGNFARSSAATAAACGAAADVPQKRGGVPKPKKVFCWQSLATTSGLFSTSGVGSAAAGMLPFTGPNRIVTGP